jgi:hypothetical protein
VYRRIALVFFTLLPALVAAQTPLDPTAPEAPASLLDLEIGDAEVDLFVDGSWTSGVSGVLGGATYLDPGGNRRWELYAFPGLEPRPFFNRVDLTLSLWLLQRYFFETTISDELDDSSLLFGYSGGPGEFLQSALIGTTAIEMGAYPYLDFGGESAGAGRTAPGATALFQTEASTHEFMVRLDAARDETLTVRNGRSVTETVVAAASYVRNRYFVLPDGGLATLRIYSETASTTSGALAASDGRYYRELNPAAETVFSLLDGTVGFDEEPAGRVLVYYESGGVPVGDAALGNDSFYSLNALGYPDASPPASFSFSDPTELLELYGFTDTWATLPADTKEALAHDYFRVTIDGQDALLLYEPGRWSPFERAAFYESPVELTSEVGVGFASGGRSGVSLDGRDIERRDAGSLLVVRAAGAGVREYASRYPFADTPYGSPAIYGPAPDPAAASAGIAVQRSSAADALVIGPDYVPGSVRVTRNGIPTTAFEVSASGEIELTPPLGPADNLDVSYRTSAPGEQLDTLVGVGNRFQFSPALALDAALGMRWKPVRARYTIAPGQSPGYVSAGTSLSWDGSAVSDGPGRTLAAEISAGLAYAVPDATGVLRVAGMNGEPTKTTITAESVFPATVPEIDPDEGDGLDITELTRGDAAISAPSSVEPEEAGVAYVGPALRVDYTLATGQNWTGAVIRQPSGPADLSRAGRVEALIRTLDSANVRVFLQIGAIGEDLDIDGNGRRDPELAPELLYSRVLTVPEPDDGWQRVSFTLSPEEQQKLRSTRGIRIIVQRDAPGGSRAGSVLLSEVTFYGTGSAVSASPAGGAGAVTAREAPESLEQAGAALADVYPDVMNRFRPDDTSGAEWENGVLAVSWTATGSDGVRLSFPVPQVPADDYGELRLYARAETPAHELALTVETDAVNAGGLTGLVPASLVLPTDAWTEIVLALPDNADGLIDRVVVTISGTDGEVLLDELSFWRPRDGVSATGALLVTWSPDLELSAGETPILRDLRIAQSIRARGRSYPDGLSSARVGIEGSTSATARLLGADARVEVGGAYGPAGPGLRALHGVVAPVTALRLTIWDEFSRSYLGLGESQTHRSGFSVGPVGPAAAEFDWILSRAPDTTTTEWSGAASLRTSADDRLPVTAELGLDAGEERSGELRSELYFTEWARSFTELLPSGSAAGDRETRARASLKAGSVPFQVEAELGGATDSQAGDSGFLTEIHGELGAPVTLGGGVRIAPAIGRTLALRTTRTPGSARFAEDLAQAGALVRAQQYAFFGVPLAELGGSAPLPEFTAATAGLPEARYAPFAGITVTRSIESRILSLLVPVSAEVRAERLLLRQQDSVTDTPGVRTDLSFVAPNLFGRLGTRPLFGFYDTDQYVTNLVTTVSRDTTDLVRVELDVDQETRLLWLDGHAVELLHSVQATFGPAAVAAETTVVDADATLAFEWRSPPLALDGRPRLAALLGADAQVDHRESLRLRLKPIDGELFTAVLGHESVLSFDERGAITLHAGVGIGTSQPGGIRLLLGALEAGIEGTLRF